MSRVARRRPIAMLAMAAVAFACSCAELRPMIASPVDLEDYRAFRVAAAEGTRLARGKRYIERHPQGAFADEVRRVFVAEEPVYFQKAQDSNEGLRRYLADLPDGPHAEAAVALLVAYGSSMNDAELADVARRVRFEDAKLEAAAVQRRAVGEAILTAVGLLLDEDVYGRPRSEAPPKLRTMLVGKNASTWGGVPEKHEDDYFFVLPTRPERESRVLTLEVGVIEADGIVVGGVVEGSDMLVRWAEADQILRLDSSAPEDRTEAQIFAMSRLEGARAPLSDGIVSRPPHGSGALPSCLWRLGGPRRAGESSWSQGRHHRARTATSVIGTAQSAP